VGQVGDDPSLPPHLIERSLLVRPVPAGGGRHRRLNPPCRDVRSFHAVARRRKPAGQPIVARRSGRGPTQNCISGSDRVFEPLLEPAPIVLQRRHQTRLPVRVTSAWIRTTPGARSRSGTRPASCTTTRLTT